MARVETVTIRARRVTNPGPYCSNEMSYEVTLAADEGESVHGEAFKSLCDTWTQRLQHLTDQALGDRGGPQSFKTQIAPKPGTP